jgi:hypothetical protein
MTTTRIAPVDVGGSALCSAPPADRGDIEVVAPVVTWHTGRYANRGSGQSRQRSRNHPVLIRH